MFLKNITYFNSIEGPSLNPYSVTLALFTLSGLGVAIWGLTIIARGRKTSRWPSVDGVIEQSLPTSAESDVLPKIVFSYTVAGRQYHCNLAMPDGAGVTPDFAENYVKKYPQGIEVRVYYNPKQPGQATLEPGLGRGDWLIFALGAVSSLLGTLILLLR